MTNPIARAREALDNLDACLNRLATTGSDVRDARCCLDIGRAALSAPPEGYVLVPREPTPRMLEAGDKAEAALAAGAWKSDVGSVYRAMLAAHEAAGEEKLG